MIRGETLRGAYRAEIAAEAWWARMGAREQEAYLRAHPASKMGKRGHALLRMYLGADGPERDNAASLLKKAGHPLPTEPPSSRYQREEVRNPRYRPAGEHPQDARRRRHDEEMRRAREAEERRRAEAEAERVRREDEARRARERKRDDATMCHADPGNWRARPKKTNRRGKTAFVPTHGADGISAALRRHFGAGAPLNYRASLAHEVSNPQDVVRLHAHLAGAGWMQSQRTVGGTTYHEFSHPDGGYVVTHQSRGNPFVVHVHDEQ